MNRPKRSSESISTIIRIKFQLFYNPLISERSSNKLAIRKKPMTPVEKVALLRAACCVAGIDKEISASEEAVIRRLASEVGVGKASLQAMMDRATSDQEFYKEQFRAFKSEPKATMAGLLEVAIADGQISDEEVAVLGELASRLDVPTEVFQELVQQVKAL